MGCITASSNEWTTVHFVSIVLFHLLVILHCNHLFLRFHIILLFINFTQLSEVQQHCI